MGYFDETNRDALRVALDEVARSPRLGFLDSLDASYEAQYRASSLLGVQQAMMELDREQALAAHNAGIAYTPLADRDYTRTEALMPGDDLGYGTFLDIARTSVGEPASDDDGRILRFDAQIAALRDAHPNVEWRTSAEMFGEVARRARDAERRWSEADTTVGGMLGGFIGGTLAALDPRTDPLNFATLPLGGAGRTALARIAGQAAAQGAVEGANQALGVQEQRRLQGLDYGLVDAAGRIGGAAIGGAVVQGAGEALGAAWRGARARWFTDVPEPVEAFQAPAQPATRPAEAPPPQPATRPAPLYDLDAALQAAGVTRRTAPLLRQDVDHVAAQLDAWDGPAPRAVAPPRTSTAVQTDRITTPDVDASRAEVGRSVDDIARTVDPETFAVYDKLAARVREGRAAFEAITGRSADEFTALTDEIATVEYKAARSRSAAAADRYAARLSELRGAREGVLRGAPPETAALADALERANARVRDLAPAVSRAYARARDEWELQAPEREAMREMFRQGGKSLPDTSRYAVDPDALTREALASFYAPTLAERVPLLASRPDIVNAAPPGADAADIARTIVAENAKRLDEATEAYQAIVGRLLAVAEDAEGSTRISIDGTDYTFDLDRDTVVVPLDDGSGSREVSVRELLKSSERDAQELESVATCSVKRPSSPA